MTLSDDAGDAQQQAKVDAEAIRREQTLADVRRQRDTARRAVERMSAELGELRTRLAFVEKVADADPDPPKWLTPKRPKAHHATVCTILSDSHFDEVVNPDEIGGVNAYDRDIAVQRLRRYGDGLISMSRDYLAGLTFDGLVLMLGGDLFSGDIHDELAQTNADSILGSVLFWLEHLAALIDQQADHFGKVHVPVVVGNHGRRTRKPRAKGRARDNFDWLIGGLLAREFRGDDRVTFDIPDAAHTLVQVYDTVYRLEHGDSARGGSGWMGVLGPAMRRDAKVRAASKAMDQPYDTLVIGHWHRYATLPGVIVNGSSKAADEYSIIEGFGFEPPQQAMWLTVPERKGPTMHVPIYVADRAAEGW